MRRRGSGRLRCDHTVYADTCNIGRRRVTFQTRFLQPLSDSDSLNLVWTGRDHLHVVPTSTDDSSTLSLPIGRGSKPKTGRQARDSVQSYYDNPHQSCVDSSDGPVHLNLVLFLFLSNGKCLAKIGLARCAAHTRLASLIILASQNLLLAELPGERPKSMRWSPRCQVVGIPGPPQSPVTVDEHRVHICSTGSRAALIFVFDQHSPRAIILQATGSIRPGSARKMTERGSRQQRRSGEGIGRVSGEAGTEAGESRPGMSRH